MSAQLTAIVDKLLTNVSNMRKAEGGIAEDLLPKIMSKQKSGKLGSYGTNHLRIEHQLMGGRGEARRVEPISRSSSSYIIETYGLEGIVTPDDYANVEEPFEAESDEVDGLTSLIQVSKEYALASQLTSASVITQNQTLSGTSQWSDQVNSDPLGVGRAARAAIKSGSGQVANWAVIPWEVKLQLDTHPQIMDSLGFKFNQVGPLSSEQLAQVFQVQKVYVPYMDYETAKEGQSSSMSPVWGKHVVFGYTPANPGKRQKSLGYLMQHGAGSRQVFKAPLHNPPGSKSIIVQDSYDYFLVDVSCAYLVVNAVA